MEYPPLSLFVMILPALPAGPYQVWFALEMAAFAIGILGLTLQVADLVDADRGHVAVTFVLGLLALSVQPPRYFDLAPPTCLLVATLLLLLRGRTPAAGVMLALAVLTKVFPLVPGPRGRDLARRDRPTA